MNKEMYDLTSPQKSIWLTEQYYKNTNINNVCGIYLTTVPVNIELLEKAIKTFVKNNKSFRIKLTLKNGQVKQYFDDYSDFEIKKHKVKSEKERLELADKINSNGFEMLDSPLFSFDLFEHSDKCGGFIVNCNHIISDSWTSGIIANEISEIYHKIETNEDISKDSDLSYLEYIKAEQEYLDSPKYLKDKEYWDGVFETIPEVATIPSVLDNASNNLSYEAERYLLDLPSDVFAKLKKYTEKNKITLYNLFMGVYALYLGRVSNLDDFVIGTPILNRTNFKEKQTTGMFINVLPLKFHLDHSQKFSDFISKVATDSMGLLRHQRYSYNYILEDIRKKDSSNPGLYNILFSYQITKMNETNSCLPHRTSWVFNKSTLDDIDIHVFEWNDSDTIEVAYDYKKEKYSKEDISNIHERILHVLNQILDNENILLKEIEIVTEKEKNQILYEFNNTKADYPKDKTIAELFEEQVEKTPNNIAVVFEDQKSTYKELNEKANQLANYLVKSGVKTNTNVGIFTVRSINTIIGIIALLKIGCTFVPIDPEYPQNRISHMLSISKLKDILYSSSLPNLPDEFKDLNLINIEDTPNNSKVYTNKTSYNPDSNLYIIFTSGSTGTPKGVCISHKNIINLIYYEKNYTDILSSNCHHNVLQFATMSFDVSYQEIFSTLLTGNSLVLISDYIRKNIHELSLYIKNNSIDTLFIPPAYFKLLCNDSNSLNMISDTLKNIITAGEKLTITPGMVSLLNKNIKIHNHYGPAETHVATCYTIDNKNVLINPPVGKPISNTGIFILDKNFNLCPTNTIGEIAISGDCVGNGYFDNEENTSKKYITNTIYGDKLYLTGDLGFCSDNGLIYFVGRNDFQVKINGFRIETEEIDSAINSFDKIINCITISAKIKFQGYSLISYVIPKDKTFRIEELKQYLKSKLPTYMIPQYFVVLDKIPLSPNGKLDRKSLPLPSVSDNKVIVPARNKLDSCLINTISEILNINSKQISIDDNFFDLGGDSLSAISLSNSLLYKLKIEIFVKDIMAYSKISDLSDYIVEIKNSSSNQDSTTLKHTARLKKYALSSSQKGIYMASTMSGFDSLLYNIAGGVIFDKMPNVKKLEKCFKKLIARHESFRTYFEVEDNIMVQKVLNRVSFKLEIANGVFELNEEFRDFVKPFDLSKAPLLRARLVKLVNGKSALFVDMHHIVSDGTSLSIFIDELCKLYNGKSLEKIDFTYKDFSAWENKALDSGEFEEAKKYWISQFEGDIPVLNMPTNYVRPAVKSYSGNKVYSKIDEETNNRIDSVCKELGITPYMLLLSVYYILLSKYTGQNDIIVGSPIVGRNFAEVYNIIGMFVNTIPVRAKIDSNLSFKDFLKTIKNICLENYNYQDYPLSEIVNNLSIPRDTSRSPLFDTVFIYQNNGLTTVDFKGISSKFYIPDTKISKFDFSLEIVPEGNTLNLNFEYCNKLFNKPFIEDFAEHYKNILNIVLENIEIPISKINMLSEKEKNKIIYGFNATEMDYPKDKTITELFEEQATKTPDNIAVVFEDKKLTYRELNNKSNSLAYYLRNSGVSRGDFVGIMVNRSLEMIVAIIAILKAGGTYIPIDPDYPEDRIKYMLENSNAKMLLTSEELRNKVKFNHKIFIELNNKSIYSSNYDNLNCINEPSDPCYIIYTSGSTGVPKGVVLKHSNIINFIYGTMDRIKLGKKDNIISVTTISFDIFVLESLLPLLNGLKTIIASKEAQTDIAKLNDICLDNNVTVIQTTPSRMLSYISDMDTSKFIKRVKYFLIGGEPFDQDLLEKLQTIKNAKIFNMYGPTETAVWSSIKDLTNTKKITIGTPISNTKMYVLDNNKKVLPTDIPGELYISGDGVCKGYLNNKEQTNKSFVANPFEENSIMYKTGDCCKLLHSGEIEYIERIDNQVKIRGLRIELGEIESRISSFPGIKKACVIKQTINNRDFLSSYFTINKKIIISELRKYLSKSLPKYMIPSYFTILDDFPYTPNGKIDKKLLPVPNEILSNSNEEYIAPRTTMQKQLAIIFEQVLNINPIGINDNFFELGGDSILAMNLNIELKKITDKISYADIFKFPTIKQIEDKIKAENDNYDFEYMKKNYNKYKNVLFKNISVPSKNDLKYKPAGNILLTGATGFLGIHILESFIKNESGNIYCIVRDEKGLTSNSKLQQKLHYYFDDKYDSLIGKRIFTVTGDITKPGFGLKQEELFDLANNVDIVINSAGKVSHFRKLFRFL